MKRDTTLEIWSLVLEQRIQVAENQSDRFMEIGMESAANFWLLHRELLDGILNEIEYMTSLDD